MLAMLFSRTLLLVASVAFAAADHNEICGTKQYVVTSGEDTFVFNPNAWRPGDEGFQCMEVQDDPPAFDATWWWPSDAATVHSYPHVKLVTPSLPVPLSNISALLLSTKWSMGVGSKPLRLLDVDSSGLSSQSTTANVAFDLFADLDPERARDEKLASTEIMFWLGMFGYAQPLGYGKNKECFASLVIGDAEFTLYQGRNERGTNVFSWVSNTTRTSFAGEVSPLLEYLWRNGLISGETNIGLVSFGSEAFISSGNVTFSATDFRISLVTGEAPALNVPPLPATNCSGYVATGDKKSEPKDKDDNGSSGLESSRLSALAMVLITFTVVCLGQFLS
ncbi:concanavalin A-like lectin/glucanase domain-containing protein [Rhypophila decipiens]|uniref:Concanavalin A-like lectin/glucanase domain-containing protein n=1 Tax=Rhypophila decipiens TaxID=261697 RepID=A0AAN6Y140_9PEZI|nr:concanavalin A-like lectin/glucanase domain-containing protein [Rhypophila decipiens]